MTPDTAGLEVALTLQRGDFHLGLDAVIPAAGITVMLGPSGSGKSTLLRAVAGLERPRSGRIALNGELWFDAARRVNLPPRRRRAGLMFQHYALFPHLTVAGNVGFGVPRAERAGRVHQWLRALRIEDIADRHPTRISGGQRQRVALARALAAEPPVLLLDEPFSSVDAELRRHLRRLFRSAVLGARRPVLLVTHDLDDARELADHIGVLVDGELRRFGRADDVMREPGGLEVARTLGWQNLLPVDEVRSGIAHGSWGSLPCARAVPACWIGIRSHDLEAGGDGGLRARVLRVIERGPYRRIECILRDATPLFMDIPPGREPPAADSHIQLHPRGAGAVPLAPFPSIAKPGRLAACVDSSD